MSRIAYPFLTLGPHAVESTVWELVTDGEKLLHLQKYLEDWDYLRPLHLRKSLRLNREIASVHLGIPESDLDLRVFLRIGTGPGNMPRAWVRSSEVRPTGPGDQFEIDEILDGSELSGRIRLETTILSFGKTEDADALAPALDAAKVWSHEYDVLLEGSEPRFPMETVSFSRMFAGRPHATSLWFLHWSPGGIHRDFGGAVRLYVNSDRAEFVERLTSGDPLVLQTIMADVMMQLVSRVIAMEDAQDAIEQAEEGTIAGYVGNWIGLAFPGEQVTDIRSKMERRPGDFHAGILAAAEVGGMGN
jgi:hypothetical protein